jgi:hypothetical protein
MTRHRVLHYIVAGFRVFLGLGLFLGFYCFVVSRGLAWSVCCVCAWTAGCVCLGAGLGSLGLPARGVSVPGAVSFQCTMCSAPGLGLARPSGHYTKVLRGACGGGVILAGRVYNGLVLFENSHYPARAESIHDVCVMGLAL